MKTLVLATACVLVLATAAGAQSWFRCSDQLIDLGSPQSMVLELCGEPTQVAEGSDEVGEGVAIPVEEWLYSSGPTAMPTILYFRNGRLSGMRQLDGFPPT
jgi:hypothetical protein